jgi:GntR family transcriptional regulator / MocR family aminotransferase
MRNPEQIIGTLARKGPESEKTTVPEGAALLQCKMGDVRVVPEELSPSISQAAELAVPSAIRGPSALHIPLQIETGRGRPLHEQISEQIRLLIAEGKLRPGSYIPSSRQLADQLGVSRNTVLLAFSRLASEGYIEAAKGSHTFVGQAYANTLPPRGYARKSSAQTKSIRRPPILFRGEAQQLVHLGRKPIFDFFVGRPCPHCFPRRIWRRLLLKRLASAGSALSEYPHPAGLLELRHAIADHLGTALGMNVRAAQILIVNGIQEALNIIARLFVRPGTPVAIEDPCYRGALSTFESYGAEMAPVPVDKDGICVDGLPERAVSLVYVTPSHQFPTGETLLAGRRMDLLDWASRVGAYVVEDDYDSDFRFDGPPLTALAGMDSLASVIYLGTFSKSIGAGLRIGYLAVPVELAETAIAVKAILNAGQSWLDQAVLADFISSGSFARHLNHVRSVYRARRDSLLNALREHFGKVNVSGHQGGMHVMWHLPDSLPNASVIQATALNHGVGVYSLRSAVAFDFTQTPYSDRSMVLGYPALTEEQIREGIARVARALS